MATRHASAAAAAAAAAAVAAPHILSPVADAVVAVAAAIAGMQFQPAVSTLTWYTIVSSVHEGVT
jgi:hypothetical protein